MQRFVQEGPIGFAGGANLYGYGDGNPTNGRDPDGLAMAPEMTARDPNDRIWQCMGTTDGCYGGGGGDWDGNGIDDWAEFTGYAWGRQLFEAQGGTTEQWHRVWYDGVLTQQPEVRDALVALSYFGGLRTWNNGDATEYARATEVQDQVDRATAQLLVGRSIY